MDNLEKLAKLVRYYCLMSTTQAGSGHLTSSLSAADLMTVLFFGGFFRYDPKNTDYPENDRVIFSKGHASPLFYSLWTVSGAVSEKELLTYRKFGSPLEGHPSREFKYTEAPTGSLGQGLSIGLGMSLNAKIDKAKYKTFVLLGDGEMAEGSVWEAIEIAAHYSLSNLIGIIDVNRLGQSGPTLYGKSTKEFQKRISSFGWETILIDGHNMGEISQAYATARSSTKPVMIIASTVKGKGISFLEDKEGFHGKALPQETLGEALRALGEIDKTIRGSLAKPGNLNEENYRSPRKQISHVAEYNIGDLVATRKAYGEALVSLASDFPSLVVLDGEVSNSTYSQIVKDKFPEKFFEMYIAEQNMVGTAIGLARMGKAPFVSTFSVFFTRAHDQLRMAAYAGVNIKFNGSHAGVSIGEDGASQMGLEDISLFRSLFDSTVLYPSDASSTHALTQKAAKHKGIVYIRTTRMDTPVIYDKEEKFEIGGSKTLRNSSKDVLTLIGAGVTLHEALKAYEKLEKSGINVRVIDLYSIKPIDSATLGRASDETRGIIVIEDHYPEGGICEAVRSSLTNSKTPIYSLAVTRMPRSGTPEELLKYEKIDSEAIVKKVHELLK